MTRDKMIDTIRGNLAEAGIPAEKVIVRDALYGGWNIAVLSEAFHGLPPPERRSRILAGIPESEIAWADLLTPEEVEWAGGLLSEEPDEGLPLWPESLARGALLTESARFPSDEDEDLSPPIVVTFYSLRGGVGRSTALAHTARLLAAERKKVVCVDMDLEAPGLASLFGVGEAVSEETGVVQLLLDLDRGERPDLSAHLIRISEEYDLYLLPAGGIGPDYARKLRLLDPNAWYREARNPLRELMASLAADLPFAPDAILIDARTGITPMSGPMLFELADMAIIVFFPHPQARRGTELLTHGLIASRTYRKADPGYVPEIRFIASPIPAVGDAMTQYGRRAMEWVSEWLSEANRGRNNGEAIDERDITLVLPYREELATSDSVAAALGMESMFAPVRDWIIRFLPSPREQRGDMDLNGAKEKALAEMVFSAGTAEFQEHFLENFVLTDVTSEALKPEIPLVLGRKGVGKTAIFRWLAESDTAAIPVHAPSKWKERIPWLMSPDGFREAERILSASELGWHVFWLLYVIVATWNNRGNRAPDVPFLKDISFQSEMDVITGLGRLAEKPQGALMAADWLVRIDREYSGLHTLLFDGLDTGFGNSESDRARRRDAITGLFALWMDREPALSHLRFKILLREDIWRQLRFENKSHLYGRSVLVKWPEQAAFFKIVLKQAMRAGTFRDILRRRPGGGRLLAGTVDDWSGDDVWEAWTALVGERMKGGKTTFTRNWVWNRLADANNDHAPRHLLQLFHEALAWEREAHRQSPYDRSIIRPRALVQCLKAVSEQALDALREEFKELEPLIGSLEQIGRSPFQAEELDQPEPLPALAREVGLLDVYEEKAEAVRRYKVPDIYRLALGMSRKGQA